MIPKKESKDIDLNEKIDKDIEKAQEQQQDKIKKSKPKLAQAVGSKYFKIFVVVIFGIVICYKMFFSTKPEPIKKKKTKITKNAKNNEQKQMANSGIAKTKGEINKTKIDEKTVISLDNQTLANTETLNSVSVPKLTLPDVPEIPKIDKLTIKEVVEERQKTNDIQIQQKNNSQILQNNSIDDKKNNVNNKFPNVKDVKNNLLEKKEKNTVKKKINRKIKDKNGKTITITEEVEVDKRGNIVNNKEDYNILQEQQTASNYQQPLTKQLEDEIDELKNKAKYNDKKKYTVDISNLGVNTLDEMFVLSGKGATDKTKKNSNDAKDFIIFDNSVIQEKEVLNELSSSNVTKLSNLENTIPAGKIIEGTLAMPIKSESTGTISAIISKDVYGESGNKILIPKGSRAYGSYTTTSTKFQRRLLLTWTKIIRPDAIVITMSADSYDQSGKKGIEGDVDTRYGELFKNSLLYSFITLGTAIAIEKLTGIKNSTTITSGSTTVTNSPTNAAVTSIVNTASDIAEKMTDGLTDDLDPVISIPQGTIVKIISNQDIIIPIAYKQHLTNVN